MSDSRKPFDPTFVPVDAPVPDARAATSSVDPQRNFTISVEERIRALTIGVPAYAARKRRIEDAEEKLVETMVAHHDALRRKQVDDRALVEALRERAAECDFAKINDLIDKHNRYYPIEANLAIDRETGGYLIGGRPWRTELSWDPQRLLECALARIASRDAEVDERARRS